MNFLDFKQLVSETVPTIESFGRLLTALIETDFMFSNAIDRCTLKDWLHGIEKYPVKTVRKFFIEYIMEDFRVTTKCLYLIVTQFEFDDVVTNYIVKKYSDEREIFFQQDINEFLLNMPVNFNGCEDMKDLVSYHGWIYSDVRDISALLTRIVAKVDDYLHPEGKAYYLRIFMKHLKIPAGVLYPVAINNNASKAMINYLAGLM